MRTDKTRAAGDEKIHCKTLAIVAQSVENYAPQVSFLLFQFHRAFYVTMTRRLFNCFLLPLIFAVAQFSARAESALAKSALLENDVAYLRVAKVEKNLAGEIQSAESILLTNKINGIILDLRFASGDDSDFVKAVTDLFAAKKLPLAILVNAKTTGAAAKLAEDLRTAHEGLIFGSSTEIKPDMVVNAKPADEKTFLENPYVTFVQSNTNSSRTNDALSFIEHVSEADLVRAKIKDGPEAENFEPPHPAEPPKTVLRDPVLARALDLMRGLTIFHAHS